jgi:O-methyltransferase
MANASDSIRLRNETKPLHSSPMTTVRQRLGEIRRVVRGDYHVTPNYFGRAAYKLPDLRTIPGFGEAAQRAVASGTSSLYYDRLYTLWAAVEECGRRFGPLSMAEVGVWKGGTSRFLLDIAPSGSTLNAFDTFEGHDGRDIGHDGEHAAGSFSDTSIERVRRLLPDARLHQGRFSDTCHAMQGRRFHVVHLDVDIYEPMQHALRFFATRMHQGGIIVVDDYGFSTCPGVLKAVDEFDAPHFDVFKNLLTGQARLVYLEGDLAVH